MAGPNVKFFRDTSICYGAERIVPARGKPGYNILAPPDGEGANYFLYVLPGEHWPSPPKGSRSASSPTTGKFVIASGQAGLMPTSNKWWSPALLQHQAPKGEDGWVIKNEGPEREIRSARMVNEPFCI